MSLLQSAIEAIEIGVEDFKSADNRRIASAVRNFYAGVLLILKEKLRRESPPASKEVLLYEKLVPQRSPSGEVTFVGMGRKTVDRQGIIERFKHLDLKLDKKRLERLGDIRNEFEHHVPMRPLTEVQAAIEATFVLVCSILRDQLELEPSTEFKPETWAVMLAEAETYKKMADDCRESLEAITDAPAEVIDALELLQCAACDSRLLHAEQTTYFGGKFRCLACGEFSELPEIIEEALASAYAYEAYRRGKDGGEAPIGTCPHCGLEAFSTDADVCLACGEGRAHQECWRCGASLSLDEQENDGLCGYCQHMWDKLDDD